MSTASLLNDQPIQILCYYTNPTDRPQIVKVGSPFERVVPPGQSILFQAQTDALLEVYALDGNTTDSDTVLLDRISCPTLRASKAILSQLVLRIL